MRRRGEGDLVVGKVRNHRVLQIRRKCLLVTVQQPWGERKQEGKRGSVGIVAAYLGIQEGLKGGGMREQMGRNGEDAGRCRSVRGDARGF